jgi:outer membrane protein with beta-barrel domain
MQIRTLTLENLILLVIVLTPVQIVQAQEDCGDECKLNTNLGMIVSFPVNPSAQVVGAGWGIVGGAGYNLNQRHAIVGEFMWTRVYPSGGALQPLQSALQSKDLNGNTDLYALTGNYRFEFRGRLAGVYLIGGGGWYYRNTWLSKEVNSGTGNPCTPVWRWFGYSCSSGIVNPNQPPVVSTSHALGANGGIGLTARVGEAPYRFYAEARYHYAPTKNMSTQLIVVTVGIRY